MAPPPIRKAPGLSHADSEISRLGAGLPDSPRQTRSGHEIQSVPQTPKPWPANPRPAAAVPAESQAGPSTHDQPLQPIESPAPASQQFVREGTEATQSTADDNSGSSNSVTHRLRDSTPIGGARWDEVHHYLLTREGAAPKVVCLFYQKLLEIKGLQEHSNDTEPHTIIGCGHMVGADCWNQYLTMTHYLDATAEETTALCPTCRRSASSGRVVQPPSPGDLPPVEQLTASALRPEQRAPRSDTSIHEASPLSKVSWQPWAEPKAATSTPFPAVAGAATPGSHRTQRKRQVFILDPEVRNEQGNYVDTLATIAGRLARRGIMAVELPSNNPDFLNFIRRYSVKYRTYWIK